MRVRRLLDRNWRRRFYALHLCLGCARANRAFAPPPTVTRLPTARDEHRPRARILSLALPIIGGMLSQNVMNLVDTAMVGSLGPVAASFATFLSQAFLTGVQAMAARRKGEGNDRESAVPLNGGLILAVSLGVPLSVLLYFLSLHLFPYLNDDPNVISTGVPYWQTRLIAVTAVAMNFCFRGFWNGVDLSRLYMRTLIFMHVVNIATNYVLIFGKLGFPAPGAIGTTSATLVGTGTYFLLGLKHARGKGFLRGLPDAKTIRYDHG